MVEAMKEILGLIKDWLPSLTVVVGAIWALYKYLDHQEEVQRNAKIQSENLAITRRIEAQKPFLEKQLRLYFEAAEVAGRLATLKPENEKWETNENRFWQLYWSELSVIETSEVENAMVAIGDILPAYKAAPKDVQTNADLDNAIYDLAHAIRNGIESGWRSI